MSVTNAAPLTVGFFSPTFPRDPIDVNVYTEHLLLGQILEPLVEVGADGSIIPAVAETWRISSDGHEIHFKIKKGLRFSNGTPVTSQDVRFSILRHLQSEHSQSKEYLKQIQTIEAPQPHDLVIKMHTKYVALFKVLSRDHLGILPNQWQFDPKSKEPFTGSGRYRAVKRLDGWYLEANPWHPDYARLDISEWKLAFSGNETQPSLIPDLLAFGFKDDVDRVTELARNTKKPLKQDEVLHFFQISAWWYPHAVASAEAHRRTLGMSAIRELMGNRARSLGFSAATGLVPQGIPGYLKQSPPMPDTKIYDSVKDRSYQIAVLAKDAIWLNDPKARQEIETKYRIKLQFTEFTGQQVRQLTVSRPDIMIFSFGGGFLDPEGFFAVIPPMLSTTLPDWLGQSYSLYQSASTDQDWQSRAQKYQALSRDLIETGLHAPGWRLPISRLRRPDLMTESDSLRYIPKLSSYRLGKEVK